MQDIINETLREPGKYSNQADNLDGQRDPFLEASQEVMQNMNAPFEYGKNAVN